ncbi:hypothetical protein J6O86_08960 [bacterium]|nr:hypothetical protein [bacterium]
MGKKTYKHPRQYTTETFIERLKELYGDKFGYEKVNYNGAYQKITLVCPVHGDFDVRACIAARGDANCKKCSNKQKSENSRIPFSEIIERIHEMHPEYIIDKNQIYKNTHTKIKVICPIHGEFLMKPFNIFQGQGCPKCGREKIYSSLRYNKNWLLEKNKEIHGDKYDLSKFKYVNTKTKGIVICKKHGEFLISPEKLISRGQGCPICKQSHLEELVENILKKQSIKYIGQFNENWLSRQSIDFYLPEYNIAIECQGIQHYEPTRFGGVSMEKAKENLEYVKKLDEKKKMLCENHNIRILYIKHNEKQDAIKDKILNFIKSQKV